MWYKTFLSIFIEKSKTDVYLERSWVYLTKLDTALCPIELVSQYFKKGNIRDNCQKYIFRGIITTKSHSKLRSCDKDISYICVRENATEGLKKIEAETNFFGLTSLRAGGATAAANFEVNDRLLKKHGRWKLEKDKDWYIHGSIEAKLLINYFGKQDDSCFGTGFAS